MNDKKDSNEVRDEDNEKPFFSNGNVLILCKQLQQFAFVIYRLSQTETLMPNLVISPLSLASILSLVWTGAKENTADQLKTLLHLDPLTDDPSNVHGAFEELLRSLRPPIIQKSILQLANRIYVHNEFRVHSDFLAQAQNHYATTVPCVDFITDVDRVRNAINYWVEDSTQKHVKELISQGGLDHLSRAVLISCVHFKCPWQRKFYHDPSHPGRFFTDKEKSTAMDVIQQQGRYPYFVSKSLKCSAIEIPYSGDRLSCIIILPRDVVGLSNLEAKMNAEELDLLLKSMKLTTVNIMLPRFHIETSLVFADALASLGISDLFSRRTSNLSNLGEGIEDKHEKIFVSALYHGVQVEISEEGGSKTLMPVPLAGNSCLCVNSVVQFTADHPFMFVIRDVKSDMILFMGRIREPTPPKKV